ncbi:MAG: nucleotide exchange factor GrpE [Bacteroidaceae bacterium]|nr:nucleotide exchange factor GrpE [Bacteroidaceae bacterium]
MSNQNNELNEEEKLNTEATEQETAEQAEGQAGETVEEAPAEKTVEEKLADALAEIEDLKNKALYKQAEFENYRKRVITEKADLIMNGGKKVLEAMLPVVDDMERALAHMNKAEDVEGVKEGVDLIYKKFMSTLKAQGVTPMETQNADFNTDYHEAVTQFPAPSDELKGKVIDCVEHGYMINDKVLRYAKVVVGI